MSARGLMPPDQQFSMLPAFDEHLLVALERRYLDLLDFQKLELVDLHGTPDEQLLSFDPSADLAMLRVDNVVHEGEADAGLHLAHFQSVLASVRDESSSLIYSINGEHGQARIYYGLRRHPGRGSGIALSERIKLLAGSLSASYLRTSFQILDQREIFE